MCPHEYENADFCPDCQAASDAEWLREELALAALEVIAAHDPATCQGITASDCLEAVQEIARINADGLAIIRKIVEDCRKELDVPVTWSATIGCYDEAIKKAK